MEEGKDFNAKESKVTKSFLIERIERGCLVVGSPHAGKGEAAAGWAGKRAVGQKRDFLA